MAPPDSWKSIAAWATGASGEPPAGIALGTCGGVVVVGGGDAVVAADWVSCFSPPVLTMRCVSTCTACCTTGTWAGLASVMSIFGAAPVGVTFSTSGSVAVVVTVPVLTGLPDASGNVASMTLTVTGTSGTPLPAAFFTEICQSAVTPMVCGVVGAVTLAVHGPRLAAASAVSFCTAACALAGSNFRWASES